MSIYTPTNQPSLARSSTKEEPGAPHVEEIAISDSSPSSSISLEATIDLETYLAYTANERLVHMPPKGSQWDFFHRAISTTNLITEVVEEITETIVETKASVTVVETAASEIWETNYQRCRQGKTDRRFLKSCLAVINLYLKLENWAEAEAVIRKTLEITRKDIFSVDSKLIVEGEFIPESVRVAQRLAMCYRRQRQFGRAYGIYLRIYNAFFSTFRAENVQRVIEIYNKLGRKEAYDCYAEIATLFSKDGCYHGSALDAAIVVLNHYPSEERWDEIQEICVTLWTTFVHHNVEIKSTQEIVELIYEDAIKKSKTISLLLLGKALEVAVS
ncbi:hypothetical protein LY76DRAFT_644764 [Colletotrichum caudatum]|nr:hypothetical protein LY76DRAFT_644764 [Colletotrichum caudatum]